MADDKKITGPTADEVTLGQRCAIPASIYNQILVISAGLKKTNCEVQTEVLGAFVEQKRLERECAQNPNIDERYRKLHFI